MSRLCLYNFFCFGLDRKKGKVRVRYVCISLSLAATLVNPFLSIILQINVYHKIRAVFNLFLRKGGPRQTGNHSSKQTVLPCVCTLPLVFAFVSVTCSLLEQIRSLSSLYNVFFHCVVLQNHIFAHTLQLPDCHTCVYRVISFSCPCFCPYVRSKGKVV